MPLRMFLNKVPHHRPPCLCMKKLQQSSQIPGSQLKASTQAILFYAHIRVQGSKCIAHQTFMHYMVMYLSIKGRKVLGKVDAQMTGTLSWADFGAEVAENQSSNYDPEGEYVRHWLPELARVPTEWIHHPWDAPFTVLKSSRGSLESWAAQASWGLP